MHHNKILAIFPLHDRAVLDRIQENIMGWTSVPWTVSYYDLKEYFGEKIALYNVFVGHYSMWLIIPAVVGFIFQMVVWGTLDFSSPVLPFFSLMITTWGMVKLIKFLYDCFYFCNC